MAQTATIRSHEQAPRISQVLPTVKCSNCGQPVPLAELGDHICPPLPPPSLLSLQKPSMSPKSAASLLPQRLQNLVSRSATPPTRPPEKLSGEHERVLPPPLTPLTPLTPSQHDPFQRLPPDIPVSKTTTLASILPPQTVPPTASTFSDRNRLPLARPPTISAPDRVSTPIRNVAPPVLQRVRTPSNATRPGPVSPVRPNPFNDTGSQPIPGRPRAGSLARRENLPPPQEPLPPPPRSLFGNHAPSNATPPPSMQPRPSFERARTSSANPAPRPSLDKPRPSIDKPRPSLDAPRPSLESQPSSAEQNSASSTASLVTRPPRRTSAVPTSGPPQGTVPFPSSTLALPPSISARHPPPPPITLPYSSAPVSEREIDTQSGGEAGMAGVGRRGFAAAARAAMLSTPHQPVNGAALGDGRRFNAPQYLDIMRAAMTPPLSPNSGQTPSPVSPYLTSPSTTPTSGKYPNIPSPRDADFKQAQGLASHEKGFPLSASPSDVRIVSPSRTPSPIPNPFERHLSGETVTQSPMPGGNMDLAFLNAMKLQDPGNESDDESVYTTHTELKKDEKAPMSPSADSDLGLAYADDPDDTPVVMPLHVRKSAAKDGTNKVKFPTMPSPDRSRSSGPIGHMSVASISSSRTATTSIAGPSRSRSASAATQSTARSGGALERAMETLIEEGASVSILASGSVLASIGGSSSGRAHGKPSRSNTVPGPASPEQKPPKLPTRSHTSPSHPHVHSERMGVTGEVARIRNRGAEKRKTRVCAGCDTNIEDGRWIQMDGGSFLCERCWKNMYLPKCRRCNLPIEKQAVSSRDGQLKGKYHRNCFNCHTCQKPFPDKEFYVFDGKPFCAYHYHEANNSLCAAPSCGQPIEGPCAVTHSGKRFHPEHLLCEFEGGCRERLVEYWEVDGQMLCERHACLAGNRESGWRGNDLVGDTHSRKPLGTDRVMKRMTRFIDLGAGEDDDVDIR